MDIMVKQATEKVSVIIPIYKVEPYLRQCLDSVVGQTYQNLEIICVDDGSPDRCGDICEEYSSRDNRIRVIHRENGGLSAARNTGIDAATGEYICFIDSDDYVKKTYVEYLYGLIMKYDAEIAVCPLLQYISEQNIETKKSGVEQRMTPSEALSYIFQNSKYVGVYAWNKMYHRDVFTSIRYPEGKCYEDSGTTYRLFLASKNIAIGKVPQYYYRVSRSGQITSSGFEKKMDKIAFIDEMRTCFERCCPDVLKSFECYAMWSILDIYRSCLLSAHSDLDQKREMRKKTLLGKEYVEGVNAHLSTTLLIQYYFITKFPNIYLLTYKALKGGTRRLRACAKIPTKK